MSPKPPDPGSLRAYRAFGLRVHSPLSVPGAQPLRPSRSTVCDLRIAYGSIPEQDPVRELGPYRLTAEHLIFSKPAVARYACSLDGTRLTIDPAPQRAAVEEIAAMLPATALPVVLWLRGHLVLHAAAAVLPGETRAIAFLGPSSIGKSTLLRKLLAHGARVLTDDVLALAPGSATATGLPAATQEPVPSPGFPDGEPVRRLHPVEPARQVLQARLATAILLSPDTGAEPYRLHASAALPALLENLHRPAIPRLLQRDAAVLRHAAALLRTVPVYSWNPRDVAPQDAVRVLQSVLPDSSDVPPEKDRQLGTSVAPPGLRLG